MKGITGHKYIRIICALMICLCLGTAGCSTAGSGDVKQDSAAPDTGAQEPAAAVSEEASESDEPESAELISYGNLEDIGITLRVPAAYENTAGLMDISGADISGGQGVYTGNVLYIGVTMDEYTELAAKEDLSDEELQEFQGSVVPLFEFYVIDADRDAGDLVRMMDELAGEGYMSADQLTPLGKAGDCSFFVFSEGDVHDDNYNNLRGEFAKEYDELFSLNNVVLENMEFAEVKRPYADLIGSKVVFETTDLDGSPVSSEEIFAEHEITMVNVWATWCYWCLVELPELETINSRLAEKDCAIIGICGDAESDETIALAKSQLEENGDTYRNICPWEGWTDTFDMSQGWPTTFFVDRSGTIIGQPVIGAAVTEYESRIEKLLTAGTGSMGSSDSLNEEEQP